jgi:cytochrome c-type biogenesis protein CcmH/NrfG
MNDKNRETQLTAEFADLIQTLERPEVKPYAPALAQEEKMKLRRRLLVQAERPFLSRRAVGNLWRFAGTAVFLAVVIVIGAYFWGILSNPGRPDLVRLPHPSRHERPLFLPPASKACEPIFKGNWKRSTAWAAFLSWIYKLAKR